MNREKSRRKYLAELVKASMENRMPMEIPEDVSVKELMDIAFNGHMVYPLFSSLVKMPLDEQDLQIIKASLQKSVFKTLQQVFEAKKITEAFEKAGIRHQMLKGTELKFIYARPEMREMSDIDCMVYEENFEKADQIMQEFGYTKLSEIKHHIIYKKAPFLVFEMHWDLYEKTVDKEQYLYYKDQVRAVLKPGFQYTYEFSKEDFYVYMISHMAKHFYEQGCGIRNLMDIYVYLEKFGDTLDCEYIDQELKRCGITKFENHARTLSYIWLEGKDSSEFYDFMFDYMVDCGIYGKKENGVWGQIAKQVADNNDEHYNTIHFMFPKFSYMKEQYPWLEGKAYLLPIAWVIRGTTKLCDSQARDRLAQMKEHDQVEKYKIMYSSLALHFSK